MSQQCCTHKLTACDDTEDVIYTKSAGLRKRVGKVVTLSSPADSTCRTVERFCGSLPEGESWTAVTVDEEFEDCEECEPTCDCYKLTNCANASDVIYTNSDLSARLGKHVTIDGVDNKCWLVSCESDNCESVQSVTVIDEYDSCQECLDDIIETGGGGCGACIDGKVPRYLLIELSGVAPSSGSPCSTCGVYNVNYIVEFSSAVPFSGGIACIYNPVGGANPYTGQDCYDGGAGCTTSGPFIVPFVVLQWDSGPNQFTVRLGSSSGCVCGTAHGHSFVGTPVSGKGNCLAISESAWNNDATFPDDGCCDWSAASAIVSAL